MWALFFTRVVLTLGRSAHCGSLPKRGQNRVFGRVAIREKYDIHPPMCHRHLSVGGWTLKTKKQLIINPRGISHFILKFLGHWLWSNIPSGYPKRLAQRML